MLQRELQKVVRRIVRFAEKQYALTPAPLEMPAAQTAGLFFGRLDRLAGSVEAQPNVPQLCAGAGKGEANNSRSADLRAADRRAVRSRPSRIGEESVEIPRGYREVTADQIGVPLPTRSGVPRNCAQASSPGSSSCRGDFRSHDMTIRPSFDRSIKSSSVHARSSSPSKLATV